MSSNRRQHYRISYVETDAPTLSFQGKRFRVLNLSEGGFEFALEGTQGLTTQTAVHGALNFSDGESVLVLGKIHRINGDRVSVMLSTPVPLRRIMEEQRRLIEKYPPKKAQ